MPKGSFVRLNEEADAEGRDPFANPRNAAAGSLRQKDPKVTARRDLATFIYAIADTDPLHVHSQREFLDWLRSAGFSVNPNVARCATPAEVHEFCAQALEHRGDLDYDIDGVVVKVDSFQQQLDLALPLAHHAGPLPLSSRPRKSRPSCAKFASRWAAPVYSRRSPSSTR